MTPYWIRRRRALAGRERALKTLERVARGEAIVAGPWLGRVGFELLYWIPLLRWLTEEGGVRRDRILAISRGDAKSWYSDVSAGYLDVLDGYSSGEVKRWSRERLGRSGNTDTKVHRLDREVFRRTAAIAGTDRVTWIHPSIVTHLFAPRWEFGAAATMVAKHTVHRLLPPEPALVGVPLPELYAAAKVSFNACFPSSRENRLLVDNALRALAEQTPVVLLRTHEEAYGHEPYAPARDLPVIDLFDHLDARTNLRVQSRVIRDARALFATYGGFAFLGPFVGTPTLAVYSHARFNVAHLDAMDRVGRRLQADTQLFRARHTGALRGLGLAPLLDEASALLSSV